MNKSIFAGRLAQNPEITVFNGDKKKANFALAVQRDYKNRNGERPVDFLYMTASWKNAETVEKYLKKGDKILVVCSTETYTKDGITRTIHPIEMIEFLDVKYFRDQGDAENEDIESVSDEELPDEFMPGGDTGEEAEETAPDMDEED